jgi:hypothetical protein
VTRLPRSRVVSASCTNCAIDVARQPRTIRNRHDVQLPAACWCSFQLGLLLQAAGAATWQTPPAAPLSRLQPVIVPAHWFSLGDRWA